MDATACEAVTVYRRARRMDPVTPDFDEGTLRIAVLDGVADSVELDRRKAEVIEYLLGGHPQSAEIIPRVEVCESAIGVVFDPPIKDSQLATDPRFSFVLEVLAQSGDVVFDGSYFFVVP